LIAHMSLSFMCSWGDAPLKADYDIEKGIGEMYYGHTLAWSLFNDETDLGNMYYWYLVYDRMYGTPLINHYEYTSYIRGEWLALLLDEEIQERSNNSKNLNTVINALYQKYEKTNHAITYQDLQIETELITNSDFSIFFSQYVDNNIKIPAYEYISSYQEYFLNLPTTLENTYNLKLYGKTFPLFILIEMTTNLEEHIWAGMFHQKHLDEFASYIITLYNIETINETDIENALSDLTDKDCTGFFNRWVNSFGKLSLTELKEWLYSYKNDEENGIRPILRIKANGESKKISIPSESSVSITIELHAGDKINQKVDWYVSVNAPFGSYSYVYPTGWIAGKKITIQTNIFNLESLEVLNMILPVGNYTFYFTINDYADSISVNVQ